MAGKVPQELSTAIKGTDSKQQQKKKQQNQQKVASWTKIQSFNNQKFLSRKLHLVWLKKNCLSLLQLYFAAPAISSTVYHKTHGWALQRYNAPIFSDAASSEISAITE